MRLRRPMSGIPHGPDRPVVRGFDSGGRLSIRHREAILHVVTNLVIHLIRTTLGGRCTIR